MNASESQLHEMKQVLVYEAQAILDASTHIGVEYSEAIDLILRCKGKLVVTGVGKSGLVARKIAATMTSTGTRALFLHPTEAMHGDLGIITENDIVIAISKSGESDELNSIFWGIKRIGAKIIAMTSEPKSTLAQKADIFLHCSISQEACPHNLAPTSSTTLTMAIGDALAITLMKLRGFKPNNFAAFHPGGKLGRRLLLEAQDIMIPLAEVAVLNAQKCSIHDVVNALMSNGLGIVIFQTCDGSFEGIITEGNLRNLLNLERANIFNVNILDVINRNPLVIEADTLAIEVIKIIEESHSKPLNVAPVVKNGKVVGILRTHELLKLI